MFALARINTSAPELQKKYSSDIGTNDMEFTKEWNI